MSQAPTDSSQPALTTAVVPVAVRDLDRASLLLRTLDLSSLPIDELQIIVPDRGKAAAKAQLSSDHQLTILSETELLGRSFKEKELRSLLAGIAGRDWYMQQMLKLAATSSVETPWCLLLDADVLVTRDVGTADLFDNEGRARVVRLDSPHHPKPYRSSARLLGLPQLDHEYGVTPVTLHRDTCRGLLRHIEAKRGGDWFTTLSRRVGWTEFSLYFTFSDWSGATALHHAPQGYDDWFAPSVWEREDWAGWNPAEWIESSDIPPFCVVQSHAQVPTEAIRERLRPWLEP